MDSVGDSQSNCAVCVVRTCACVWDSAVESEWEGKQACVSADTAPCQSSLYILQHRPNKGKKQEQIEK